MLWEMKSCLGVLDYQVLDEGWWAAGEWAARTAAWTFFDGFNAVTWMVIFLQVTGGLLGGALHFVRHLSVAGGRLTLVTLQLWWSNTPTISSSVSAQVYLFSSPSSPASSSSTSK